MASRILIVEDEQKLREVMTLFLRTEGFDVAEASDGETALELFSSFMPELIVLDVMLPGISGFDVCKAIYSYIENIYDTQKIIDFKQDNCEIKKYKIKI